MDVKITGKEFKLIREIINSLNQEFPPIKDGIPSSKYVDGKLINFNAKIDKHFSAYRIFDSEIWWICVDCYDRWNKAHEYMKEFCNLIISELKLKANPCCIHPVMTANLKRQHKENKLFFIGECSWS